MSDMRVIPEKTGRKPEYGKTARKLLEECQRYFSEPENQRIYMECKTGRNDKKEAV